MLLKACVNGARSRADHPALPVTAVDLAADVDAVREAGAGAVHLHAKDEDGTDTLDGTRLAEVLGAVRAWCPGMPVGVTTGAWAMPNVRERVAAIGAWTAVPDFASVNWHEDGADDVAAALLDRGIGVEAGLWNSDAVAAWQASPHRDRCLRVLLELPDGPDEAGTAAEALRLLEKVQSDRPFPAGDMDRRWPNPPVLLHGEGTSCWPALRIAADLALDTRIGLEDTLVLPDGSPAESNAELIAHARQEIASRTRHE
jgi:uncharacterized protein (DUF849 family)